MKQEDLAQQPPPIPNGTNWGDLIFLFQPSCLCLIGLAVTTVLLAAIRGLFHDTESRKKGISPEDTAITIDASHAAMFPIAGSFSLLMLFFFFSSIQFLLLILLCIAAATSVSFAIQPLLTAAALKYPALRRRLMTVQGQQVETGQVLSTGAAVGCLLCWMVTGSMFLNNVLGICLCISFISFVKLPNIKVCALLLVALFFYDIFWVFISERIFGSNVMVEAATKQAENPAALAADALHLPSGLVAAKLDLPVKLMVPQRLFQGADEYPPLMLGLGDMALPGLLIALLLSCDVQLHQIYNGTAAVGSLLSSWRFWRASYTLRSWLGYIVGMFLALGVSIVFQAAQPALLYLVPCTLGPALLTATGRKELGSLWAGLEDVVQDEKDVV